jgi:hypothetical protein
VAKFRQVDTDRSDVHHDALEFPRWKNRPADEFVQRSAGDRVVSATETTVTRVGKNAYVTREEADADMAVVCK